MQGFRKVGLDKNIYPYPVKITRLRIILSVSTVFSEPTAATTGAAFSPDIFRIIEGRGVKEIGAYIEATEKRPAWRNLSILFLSVLMNSLEKTGLQKSCNFQNILA